MKVFVIGGGASGMMSAVSVSEEECEVTLFEKNEKLGKKIYITGKGRCNLTNDCEPNEFVENVCRNGKFVYGAIRRFSPESTVAFFNKNGMPTKTERGNRVFPVSDKASDVTKTLEKTLVKNGVKIKLNSIVERILVENGKVCGIVVNGEKLFCDKIIVCTGGVSYPLTGSDGDGFRFAKNFGHTVTDLKSALCGIEITDKICKEWQGISLKNVCFSAMTKSGSQWEDENALSGFKIQDTLNNDLHGSSDSCDVKQERNFDYPKFNGKTIFSDTGEMLFTHYGISGPLVLTCSSLINRKDMKDLRFFIDFKPALSYNVLEERLIREFALSKNKSISNVMPSLLPRKMGDGVLYRAKINPSKRCCFVTSCERKRLAFVLKNFGLSPKMLRPVDEAIVTSGGVDVKEINPKTMESKIVKGLFFAGEVIDVDAFTGGFNIQTAFSTGYLAGKGVAQNLTEKA